MSLAGIAFLLVTAPNLLGQSKPVHIGTLTGIGEPLNPQPLSLAASNNILYIGTALGLYVYEISDPSEPKFVTTQEGFPVGGGIKRIVLNGSRAYLASVGLRIVDVSDPAQLVTMGYIDNGNGGTNGLATDLAVSGNYVYVANGADGLRVYDVSNPYFPTNVGHWPNTPDVFGSFPQSIAVVGQHAYLANFGDGLRVFDISDPRAPVSVREFPEPRARRVTIEGERLYLLADTVSIYDISFPTKPAKLGEITDIPSAESTVVLGNFLYAGCSGFNFFGPYLYDVSSATNAIRISPRDDAFNDYLVRDLAVYKRHAYLALQFGVSIYFLGEPSAPRLTISAADARNLRVSWPMPSWRYLVEESTNPNSSNWVKAAVGPTRGAEGQNQVLLPRDLNDRFYRLMLDE